MGDLYDHPIPHYAVDSPTERGNSPSADARGKFRIVKRLSEASHAFQGGKSEKYGGEDGARHRGQIHKAGYVAPSSSGPDARTNGTNRPTPQQSFHHAQNGHYAPSQTPHNLHAHPANPSGSPPHGQQASAYGRPFSPPYGLGIQPGSMSSYDSGTSAGNPYNQPPDQQANYSYAPGQVGYPAYAPPQDQRPPQFAGEYATNPYHGQQQYPPQYRHQPSSAPPPQQHQYQYPYQYQQRPENPPRQEGGSDWTDQSRGMSPNGSDPYNQQQPGNGFNQSNYGNYPPNEYDYPTNQRY